jgi:N-acetylglucosaminyl-diphospho-decaprenol L-rhamnosyltransferase
LSGPGTPRDALSVVVVTHQSAARLALLVFAARQGWMRAKLRADVAGIAALPSSLARRRTWQALRGLGAAEFAGHLSASLSSPYLASSARVERLQAVYWRAVLRALAMLSG